MTNQIDLDCVDKMSFDETSKVLQRLIKPCSGLQRLRLDKNHKMSFDETIQMKSNHLIGSDKFIDIYIIYIVSNH